MEPFDANAPFTEAEVRGVYKAIHLRRDIRSFRPDPVPDAVLRRLLEAAHHAPSVGFMQPWNFVVVRSPEVRRRLKEAVDRERLAAGLHFRDARADHYHRLKVEGILEAPVVLCVTSDPTRGGPHVLGRNSDEATDLYSTACAVQNLWLAARAEGLAAGWVSIFKKPDVREILGIPPHVHPVGLVCLGYTDAFPDRPLLEAEGWAARRPLEELVFYEKWGGGTRMPVIGETLAAIGPLDEEAMAAARRRLDSLTKPRGSLGRLEEVGVRLAGVTGRALPEVSPRAVVVMAGDHGVVAEGVSAYPSEVTPQMVLNFLGGGAAINVLARLSGARVRVVDVGVAADLDHPGLDRRKVRPGTANMARGAAMSREEAERAVAEGIAVAREEIDAGARLLCLGDMGIGNTTAAAAVVSVLGGFPPSRVVGRGTGVDDEGLARKLRAVEAALRVNAPDPEDGLDVLAKVGGLEIAGLAGVVLGAAARRVPVVVDGVIAGAGALAAARMAPLAKEYLFAGHLSAEPAHGFALGLLGLRPLLDLEMRLGEGTGAALASLLLEAACRVMREMATFGEAGVSGPVAETGATGAQAAEREGAAG